MSMETWIGLEVLDLIAKVAVFVESSSTSHLPESLCQSILQWDDIDGPFVMSSRLIAEYFMFKRCWAHLEAFIPDGVKIDIEDQKITFSTISDVFFGCKAIYEIIIARVPAYEYLMGSFMKKLELAVGPITDVLKSKSLSKDFKILRIKRRRPVQ